MLYVVSGAPGSGKSFKADELANELNCTVYHLDDTHGLLPQNYDRQAQDVVVDWVCADVGDWMRMRAYWPGTAATLIYMRTPVDVCLSRQQERGREVGEQLTRTLHEKCEQIFTQVRDYFDKVIEVEYAAD